MTATRSISIILDGATNLATSLEGIGLTPIAGPGEPNPVRWETDDEIVLDMLTPKQRGGASVARRDGLGVWAQALNYRESSIANTIDAVVLYREGIPVRIPAPERFAVHKLIVASARRGTCRSRSGKDLA